MSQNILANIHQLKLNIILMSLILYNYLLKLIFFHNFLQQINNQ